MFIELAGCPFLLLGFRHKGQLYLRHHNFFSMFLLWAVKSLGIKTFESQNKSWSTWWNAVKVTLLFCAMNDHKLQRKFFLGLWLHLSVSSIQNIVKHRKSLPKLSFFMKLLKLEQFFYHQISFDYHSTTYFECWKWFEVTEWVE